MWFKFFMMLQFFFFILLIFFLFRILINFFPVQNLNFSFKAFGVRYEIGFILINFTAPVIMHYAAAQYREWTVGQLSSTTCPPIFMRLTGQNNGRIASPAWLARTCIMNMRNATCVGTETSKVPTRVTLLFIFYSVAAVWLLSQTLVSAPVKKATIVFSPWKY